MGLRQLSFPPSFIKFALLILPLRVNAILFVLSLGLKTLKKRKLTVHQQLNASFWFLQRRLPPCLTKRLFIITTYFKIFANSECPRGVKFPNPLHIYGKFVTLN